MRPRFKPNISSKSSRKSNASKSVISHSEDTTESSTKISINEVDSNVPFIPPNSSKTAEDNVPDEQLNVEGTNAYSEIVVETLSQNDNEKETEKVSKTSKSTKDNSKTAKPAIARRSRIKPNITPVTRKRNTPKTKTAIKNDLDNADGDQHSNETADTNDASQDLSTASDETRPQKHQEKQKNNTTTPPKDTKLTENTKTPATQQKTLTESQNVDQDTSGEDKLTVGGTLLSRRRRATPKICIPPRKKKSTPASSEVAEKCDETTTESMVEQNEAEKLQEVPQEFSEIPSKRPRLQSENVADNIDVIEITVQTGDPKETGTNGQEHEEEQIQTTKKPQVKGKRKRAPIRKPKEMLDPSKMTLQDLIYFNPKENFMKSSIDPKRKRLGQTRNLSLSVEDSESIIDGDEINPDENQSNNQQTTPGPEGEGESAVSCAPQIKIAADGSIIVDEESLVIRSSTDSTLEDKDIVYEDANDIAYDRYGKASIRKRWTMPETLKFYKALSQVGTDFQLMVPLFPTRSRKELKAKFKKEEKQNHHLVDRALVHRTPISLDMFSKQGEKKEEPKQKPDKKRGRRKKVDTTEENAENDTEQQTENKLEKHTENETEKQIEKQTGNKIEKQKEIEIEKQTESEIEKQTESEIEKQTESEIEKQKEIEIEKQTESEIEKQTESEIEKQTESEIEKQTESETEKQAEQIIIIDS